ncbi:MAG: zf-HC2 domain-containing protein [Alphaproteobacteria bacterium]|nr:zf-HC2 domain-containing protein [Alphaproteobacteria bacterium]
MTMTCEEALEPLHDRLDGPLPPALDEALQEHLAGCEPCRRLAADLDRLRIAAGELPREIEPSRDLWPGIAARIGGRSAWWQRPQWLLAALVLVALGSSALTALALRAPDPAPVDVAGAELPWGDELDHAADELRAAVEARRGELDPETLAVVEENLRIIDAAVAETRAALDADPTNRRLQRSLAAAGEQRIALLRHALTLPQSG